MGDLRQSVRVHDDAAVVAVAPYGPGALAGTIAVEPAAHPTRQSTSRSFIDELYASSVESQRLPIALMHFARAFEADEACLFTKDLSGGSDKVNVLERGFASDTQVAYHLEFDSSQDEVFAGRRRRPEASNAVRQLRRAGSEALHYLAVAPEGQGQPPMGIAALRRHAPFTDGDIERARTLVPDIRRALELKGRAGRIEALGFGIQMFDQNPIAILITRQRAIERTNAAASALLAFGRPIGSVAGKLQFEDSRAHTAFELISRNDGQTQSSPAYAFIVDGTGGRTWIAQLSLARSSSHNNAANHAVVVALTPFNTASQTREAMLNGFTDLTPTERSIFAAFVDGEDIAAIAARMNRSVETVRWHVRNLFTKLGVNSQADLARLGALLLPI